MKSSCGLLLAILVLVPTSVSSQLVPPRPGVELPQAYYDRIAVDKNAFQFDKAWKARTQRAKETRERFLASTRGREMQSFAAVSEDLRQAMMVSGTVEVPVLLAKFQNTANAPYEASTLQTRLFAPAPAASMTGLYHEMSYGNVNLTGTVYDWVTVAEDDYYYDAGCNGICAVAKTGQFILEVLQDVDPYVDFGDYDNDGPDGDPNSGDDDGLVDFVALVHPETGGECGTSNLWSHRWFVGGWPEFGRVGNTAGDPWVTNDPSQNGGFVKIWDYTIQPALGSNNGCGAGIIEIGVFCHEFGHAFGLPDLYDTNGGSEGIGHWGLMGSGNWNKPSNPAHMCAWSKMELGWLIPIEVGSTAQVRTIANVATNSQAYKLNIMEEKFRRDSFFPIQGGFSLHCGLKANEANARNWPGGAGYGNSWDESIKCEFSFDGSLPVILEYDYQYSTEPNFDFAFVKIDVGGTVTTLRTYDDMGTGYEAIDLTPYLSGSGVSSYHLIAQFVSDYGYSDEDGNFDANILGAFKLDNIAVTGGGESYVADFESDEGGWYYDHAASPTKEFFLIENRSTDGQFDQWLYNEGLAIWHIEQNVMAEDGLGNTGGDNNATTRGVTLEEADGLFNLISGSTPNRGDTGDVFPGSMNKRLFDNGSNPSSLSHNGLPTRALVSEISNPGPLMTARMRGGFFAPQVSSITPAHGYNDRTATITGVAGNSYVHGATFLLRDASNNDYAATTATWIGKSKLAGVFDLNGLATGDYDVVVRNPDGQEAVLEDGFLVKDIVPVFIRSLDAVAGQNGVLLRWEIVADEAIKGYKILRRELGDSREIEISGGTLIDPGVREYTDDSARPGTDYEYVLLVVLGDSGELRSSGVRVKSAGFTLSLGQNYPNPFNPTTRIDFSLPERSHVSIVVYDPAGRQVMTLVDDVRPAGVNNITWNGKNASGDPVSSGVYFYRLTSAKRVLTRKMILLR
ncbi:MAG: M6 family metalloprotease domain-containing protein [Candidatus Latescibacterota bacterium]|nr:MAG: M6 family metalloprotease domain-containing protein [Candidatus Latescibacterota bacterium]